MKRPNWKLYRLIVRIDLGFLFLCLIGLIVLLLSLYDSTFPVFKYSLLCISLITYFILIISSIWFIAVIKSWRKRPVSTLSNHKKAKYSISCLLSLFLLLSSIEYLSYINNKEKFNIENNYIKDSTRSKILDIKNKIKHCKSYINAYNHISEKLKGKKYIGYNNIDDFYFTIIDSDTIEIKINRKETIGSGTNGIYINSGLDHAENIEIFLNKEFGHISHPTSKTILKSMQQNDSINGIEFNDIIHQKIQRYQDKLKEYQIILEDEVVITFGDFVIYSIFNPSITGNKTNIFIRFIFLLHAIVITFFSGYIYQTLYKILDGENNKKPKA